MKYKTSTLLLILLTWITCRAQDQKFDFGINLFPNYSSGLISNDGNTPSGVENNYKAFETWKPSFSTCIFVEYKLSEKSSIGLGIGYQNNGERTRKTEVFHGFNPYTGEPITYPNEPNQVRFIYNHHNIEIPIYYRHKFGNRFYLIAGTSALINLSNTVTSEKYYADGSKKTNKEEDETTDFRKLNFSVNLGFGIDYLKREKFSLFVHPNIQSNILGVSKSASLNRNILSLGISTGIRIY